MIWNAAIANEADVPDATVIEKVIDRMLLAVPSNRQNLYDTDMLGGVPYIYMHMYVYIYTYICTVRTYAEILIPRCVALRICVLEAVPDGPMIHLA